MNATWNDRLPERIPVGVSACLLGEPVRWDGTARRDPYIAGTLARWFRLVPVCPEVAIGLGVPRPPIRLVGRPESPRVRGVENPALDVTVALAAYGRRMAGELDGVCGYIFKARSPSCGMERVPVHPARGGRPVARGVGHYARVFMAARPELPCEEEEGLGDPGRRAGFVTRVVALARWRALAADGITAHRLADFHRAHTLVLLAHDAGSRLKALAALIQRRPPSAAAGRYLPAFMAALRQPATRRGHAAVFARLAGALAPVLNAADRRELRDTLRAYRARAVPLAVPLTLLRHHLRRYPLPEAEGQVYLDPHPAELALADGE